MHINYKVLRRPAAALTALALVVGTATPALLGSKVFAANQVTNRSIQMSDSAPSGGSITSGVGSGTNVSYSLTFTTSSAIQSVVVDFCGNTPLIGDTTCSAVTGLDMSAATLTANGTWSLTPAASQLKFTNSASQAAGTFTLEVNGVTNPTAPTMGPNSAFSFYARMSAYTDATYGTYGGFATPGNYTEYGGVALSINNPITVTARVMETLGLCASSVNYTGVACAGPTATDTPSVTLGHGPNLILDTSRVDTADVYTQISTNAANGYALYLRASNSCAGLSKDNGATCGIPAVNAGAATGATIVAGTAAFGATVSDGTTVSGGSGTNTAVARWKTTAPTYIMDNTTASDNVTYTYGSKIASSPSQANGVINTITFAATASPTTAAGIYSENFSLIGVGTF